MHLCDSLYVCFCVEVRFVHVCFYVCMCVIFVFKNVCVCFYVSVYVYLHVRVCDFVFCVLVCVHA